MKNSKLSIILLLFGIVLATPGARAASMHGFGFMASDVGGISGKVFLTGGGSFRLPDTVHSGGGFKCIETVTAGPFANDLNTEGRLEKGPGCQAGEGVRWDTVELLPSIPFKCSGADTPHTASTDDKTVVMKADFYEASNGNEESFADVPMIVSAGDIRPDLDGAQNVWIAGVGCGSAVVHFN